MDLIIDIGNTKSKVAVFDQGNLNQRRSWTNLSLERVQRLVNEHNIKRSILSTVTDIDAGILKFLNRHTKFIQLNHKTKLPITNRYKTPTSLGADRLANAVAANESYPEMNVLVIDAGTCVKYDFVDDEQSYYGGSISPGLTLRYKALNTFTAKLPLVQRLDKEIWLGRNTEESIQTGVEFGLLQEMIGFIKTYEEKYDKLYVIMTGGDASTFETRLKKRIFAAQIISDPNLLVKGLHIILSYNA